MTYITESADQITAREAKRAVLHSAYWRSTSKGEFVRYVFANTSMTLDEIGVAWEMIDHMVDTFDLEDPLNPVVHPFRDDRQLELDFTRPASHVKAGKAIEAALHPERKSA